MGSFGELAQRLESGDTIFVIDRGGREVTGTLLRLSPTSLVIQVGREEQELSADEIGRIEKPGDSVWDGVLKGASGCRRNSELVHLIIDDCEI